MSYRRAVITAHGGPEVLEIREEPVLPEPGPGQVRVKTLAAGVAFTDLMIRQGDYPGLKEKPPFTPGYDLVGEIDRVGPGVKDFAVGDRVAELTVVGAQAEYVCLEAEDLVRVPSELDPAEAVSLVLAYTTAYQMLTRTAEVEAGERILVHGAGGAVGTALVQLGKYLGLEVYGTASRPKHTLVTGLGARPIDYQRVDFVRVIQDLEEPGVDAVFDHLGGDHFQRSFKSLREGGRLVAYGFYNAAMDRGGSAAVDFLRLFSWNLLPNGKSAQFYSIAPWRKRHPGWFREDLEHLFTLCVQGDLQPVIGKRISLDELKEAHRWIAKARTQGKIVLCF